MNMGPKPQHERRASSLSEDDFARIEQTFDKSIFRVFELIGYDVTEPKEREEIREDNRFVRRFRLGSAKAQVTAGLAAVTGFVGAVLWVMWWGIKAALAAKGGSSP